MITIDGNLVNFRFQPKITMNAKVLPEVMYRDLNNKLFFYEAIYGLLYTEKCAFVIEAYELTYDNQFHSLKGAAINFQVKNIEEPVITTVSLDRLTKHRKKLNYRDLYDECYRV